VAGPRAQLDPDGVVVLDDVGGVGGGPSEVHQIVVVVAFERQAQVRLPVAVVAALAQVPVARSGRGDVQALAALHDYGDPPHQLVGVVMRVLPAEPTGDQGRRPDEEPRAATSPTSSSA